MKLYVYIRTSLQIIEINIREITGKPLLFVIALIPTVVARNFFVFV